MVQSRSFLFCSKPLAHFPVVFVLLSHLFFQVYILKHTGHILPRSQQPCVKATTEDPDSPLALGKGPSGIGRLEGPAQPGAAAGASSGCVGLWGAQAGPARQAQQTHGADGAGHQILKCDFHMDVGTHPGFPSVQSAVHVVQGGGGSCVWILRVVCPKSFEKQLWSSVDPTISTEKGATLGPPEHCTLHFPLHRPDPQAPQTWLQEAQVTLGLTGFFCGELRPPLVSSNAAAKSLVCFWASPGDKMATFSKQLS